MHYRKCGSKWRIPKPPFSPKFPARHVGILDGQTPHRLALQKASYPPSTSDYSKIFSLVKPFIQMYVNTQLKTTEISYEVLESCFMRRFVRFNKIVHSSKSTFNGLFQRLSDAPTNQYQERIILSCQYTCRSNDP